MPGIHLSRPHAMEPDVLRDRVRAVEGKLQTKYGATTGWIDEHTLEVTGPGVNGRMTIRRDTVAIDLDLGFLLGPFKGKLEQGLARELDRMVQAEYVAK